MWHLGRYGGRNHVRNISWLSVKGCGCGERGKFAFSHWLDVSPLQHWSHYREISPANRSWSGPKSVHMHSSRADNVHEILGAISADKMWARTCHQLPGFFCQQYETTFLATLQWSVFTKFGPDTWLGDETQILDRNLWKFPFTVICPQNPKLGGGQTVTSLKSRLQVKGCTAKRYCLLHVVVQEPESFWGQLFCTTYGCRATGHQSCPIFGFWPIFLVRGRCAPTSALLVLTENVASVQAWVKLPLSLLKGSHLCLQRQFCHCWTATTIFTALLYIQKSRNSPCPSTRSRTL